MKTFKELHRVRRFMSLRWVVLPLFARVVAQRFESNICSLERLSSFGDAANCATRQQTDKVLIHDPPEIGG
jgi:hypothetical protein